MTINPYAGPFGPEELRHLLRRSLFGAAIKDMQHFEGKTLVEVVDELLTFSTTVAPPLKAYTYPDNNPDPNLVDPPVAFGTTWVDTVRQIGTPPNPSPYRYRSFLYWWTGLMLDQERTLREKLVLFWSNHLATQTFFVFNGELSYRWNKLLRDNCLGNFRTLIHDFTVDGACLIYLNGYLNVSVAPDENYARELFELFTLGHGSGYTESDVQAAARVLTGWTVVEEIDSTDVIPTVVYNPDKHDTGDKQFSSFFGNTVITGQGGPNGGANELNALLDMVQATDANALFICRELYRWFVHPEVDADIELNVITPLAQTFRDEAAAPDQMRTVLRKLLLSEAFFNPAIRSCMIKSPVDIGIGNARVLGLKVPGAETLEAQYWVWKDIWDLIAGAGQSIGEPPNVAGWPAYYNEPLLDRIWMDNSGYAGRKKIYQTFHDLGSTTPELTYEPQSAGLSVKVDHVALVQQFSNAADPNVLVQEAAQLLLSTPISLEVRNELKTNFLLVGQQDDSYWTDAYTTYVLDPDTTDPSAQMVPDLLRAFFLELVGAAEHELM
jgi:uncharacterized protein (DUF1800 family)